VIARDNLTYTDRPTIGYVVIARDNLTYTGRPTIGYVVIARDNLTYTGRPTIGYGLWVIDFGWLQADVLCCLRWPQWESKQCQRIQRRVNGEPTTTSQHMNKPMIGIDTPCEPNITTLSTVL